ncbi:MAG: ABC transporter permease [Deltaproteobacteria bacterium]|nr:MAG: ABC transporter permease [Deltaproteobacteria bacterium]
MKRYLFRRLLLLVPVVWGVSTLVFLFLYLIPGDPVEIMLGETAQAADKTLLRQELGLDRPVHLRYLEFLGGLVRGDLGSSFYFKQKVLRTILERYPATLELALAAMVVAIIIAVPLGIISAIRQYSLIDNTSMFLALIGVSMPNFWLGPLLILIFSIQLNLLPVSGREGVASLILPAITLGTALAAILSRMTRASMLEVLRDEYITTARAKGLKEKVVILRHALRNALIPIITVIGLQSGALLSGAIITETIFSWPGIGRLLIQAIETRDYPLVQGCVLVISFSYVVVNLLTDILYAYVDPRIRYEQGLA